MFTLTARRTLASSALLSRSWSLETLAKLRDAAKSFGLSTKGNKATLIARLEEYEKLAVTNPPAPVRALSSAPAFSKPTTPTSEAWKLAESFYTVKLPSADYPEPEPPVQIPYVPDFWASSSTPAPTESSSPKLLVVAGATTHHGGGPSHSLLPDEHSSFETQADVPSEAVDHSPPPSSTRSEGGLLSDIVEDIGLSSSGKSGVWKWFS